MKGTILLLFSVLSMVTVSFQQSCCPTNYALHISDTLAICIQEMAVSQNYETALATCESTTGGSLLKVDPISEVQEILDQLSVSVSPHWIGLDLATFTWTADGTTPTSVNWSNDDSPGNCVIVNNDGTWSNVSCASTRDFLCQVPVNCAETSCLTAVSLERCPCDMGFQKNSDSICVDIDECAIANPCSTFALTQCVNTVGGYDCVCVVGAIPVQGSMSCTENLCTMDDDCNGVMVCGNPMGSARRCQCPTGFTGADCSDVDECSCESESNQCVEQCQNGQCEMTKCAGANEVCQNGDGTFSCPCKPGFSRSSNNFCEDINECTEDMCVGQRQTCVNTPGGFNCTCDPGYELDNSGVCIESCLGRCDPTTEICMTNPTLTCSCRTGYFMLDDACTDVDECGDSTRCSDAANTLCDNTPGSFLCQCLAGYTSVNGACIDIDECATNEHDCTTTALCTNTGGSFTCACPDDQVLLNGVCTAFRGFRVKIIATELNNTVTTYQSSMDVIYERHFCQIILDTLQNDFPALSYDCSRLRFESGSVRGYLLLSIASTAISAETIESTLRNNVVTDVSGKMKLNSNSRSVSVTIVDTASIDVVDIAVYNADTNACDPSPCQNSGPCTEDRNVYDVSCLCSVGFSGERCETVGAQATQAPVSTPGNDDSSTGISTTVLVIIIVVFVVFILLILLLCCCCCCYFFTQRGGIGSPGPPGPPGPAYGRPAIGGPAFGGPGVAPIRGPHSLSGYGGYYDNANSVI